MIACRINNEIWKIIFFLLLWKATDSHMLLKRFAECRNKNVSHAFLIYTAFNEWARQWKFSIQTTFWVDPAQSNLPGPPASFRTLTTDHSRPQVNRTYTTGCIICEQKTLKKLMITSKKTGLLQCAFICSVLFVSFLYFKVILCGIGQSIHLPINTPLF